MIFQAGVGSKYTNDSQRFLLEHFDTICNSPSHIYHSALPLCPSSSWLQKCYSAELLYMVKVAKGLPVEWGDCSRTVLLNSPVWAMSYHNNMIAVGLETGDITILNAITGSQTAVLSEHTKLVNSLAFSPDGTLLVSGSLDKTVKLWDLQTGGVVKTFTGHTQWVKSVSISADLTTIASGSYDMTIRLWNIQTGECQCTIRQQKLVWCVRFSPTDPQHLLSVCDGEVWQWDTNGHQIKPPYDGSCVSFSSDGTQLVLCNEAVVTVQNSDSGVTVAEFHVASSNISCCCFSPDGKLVAVSFDNTAYVWDITSSDPHLVGTFIGHTEYISSLAFFFSSSLISTSTDQSVKFWKIGTPSTESAVTDPNSTSLTSAPIKSTALQAKDGIILTCNSDGVVKTWDIFTGLCKASFQTPAIDFDKSDMQLNNGRLLFVWCVHWHAYRKIHIWDAEKGELLFAVDTPDLLEDLKISGDGSRVFWVRTRTVQALSVQTGEIVSKVYVEAEVNSHTYYPGSLIADGSRVWVYYPNSGYHGWDFGDPGSLPVHLSNMPPLRLHPNGAMLFDISLSRVKDKATGKVVFQLSRGFGTPVDVQWSGNFLVVHYPPKEILILDFSHLLLQ